MAQSASAVASDIAQLWAAALQRARMKMLTAEQGCNRIYQDQVLRGGDTVRINTVGDITINTSHSRSADMTLQTIRTTDQTLVMDREDDYAFYLDDVDDVQAVSDVMGESARRAGYLLRDQMDQYIFTTMGASVATANQMAARTIGTGSGDWDAFETLVDMAVLLDQANAPEDNRFVYIPMWMGGVLAKDPRKSSFGTTPNLTTYGSMYVGRSAAGLEIFKSNNLTTSGSAYTIIAGTRDATTMAEQINKSDARPNNLRMGMNVLGLHVYGAKVTRPTELVSCAVTQSTDN